MATENSSAGPQVKFIQYNPYAAQAEDMLVEGALGTAEVNAHLAIAYALDRLRAEIHFAGKGRA